MSIAVNANVKFSGNFKDRRDKKANKDLSPSKRMKAYEKNPNKDKYVSARENFNGCKGLTELLREDFVAAMENEYTLRFCKGFFNALHVYAYLSGKEPLHCDAIPMEDKMCINAISESVASCRMYDTPDSRTLDEYQVSKRRDRRPIVTQELLDMAAKEFPLVIPEPMEHFSDDEVEVIDVEQNVVKAAKETKADEAKPVDVEVVAIVDAEPEEKSDDKTTINAAVEIKVESKSEETQEAVEEAKPVESTEKVEEKLDNVLKFTVKEDNPDDQRKTAITFDPEKMTLYPNSKSRELTPGQQKWFDISFGEYLKGKDYNLNRLMSGAIECVINDNDRFIIYYIDPNLCVGNGYNVLGNVETGNPNQPLDTIPVHYSEKEICKKVFADKGYILTPEEVQRCMSHMFINQRIYNVIDMSNMFNRLKKLSEDDFKKLGKKFTFIINCLPVEKIGRMRVNEWKSIDSFKLISDEKVKSPFPGQTRDNVTGVKVAVSGDNVSITIGSKTKQYTIEDYNVL